VLITDLQLDAALRLAIAAIIGLGVGLEREWSGHAAGPEARFVLLAMAAAIATALALL